MVPDMQKRGRLQVGSVANLTIFDAAKVIDNVDWKPEKASLPSTASDSLRDPQRHDRRQALRAARNLCRASITLRTAEGMVCGP